MGTHAMIGIYNADGTVTASYCHYDGYVEGVGRTLVNSYNTQYDAEVVANGGYMSGLFDDYLTTRSESVHDDIAVPYESVDQYMKQGRNYYGADYLYLWDGEAWFFTSRDVLQFEEVEMNLMSNV